MKYVNESFIGFCSSGNLIKVMDCLFSGANIQHDGNLGLYRACQEGHLDVVEFLLTSPELKKHANIHSHDDLLTVCAEKGSYELINFLTSSPLLKDKLVFTPKNYTGAIYSASWHGNLDMIKSLINLPAPLGKTLLSQNDINEAFLGAAMNGHVETVRYLLTSPDLPCKANIHYKNDAALVKATEERRTNVATVAYLLSSPELQDHIDIHTNNDVVLRNATLNPGIFKFLLTDKSLKEHADINANNAEVLRDLITLEQTSLMNFVLTSPKIKNKANFDLFRPGDFYDDNYWGQVELLKNMQIQYEVEKLNKKAKNKKENKVKVL